MPVCLSAVLATSLLAAAPTPPRPFVAGPQVEGISEYRLPNGLKVLLIPDGSKSTLTVNLTVLVGSRHENYGEKGMAHLFEHMLFKQTKKFADIKKVLTEKGADANGTTWFDRTNYFETINASDENLKFFIELEAERLVNAIISREQLTKEMTVVRNEFEMGENNARHVLGDRVLSAAFTWHNYGNTTIGARSDIENVPEERLQAFYKTYYQPDNAVLIIAGRFDPTRALQYVAASFGKIPRPRRPTPATYTLEPTQDGERSVTVRRTGGAPWLAVGYHLPALADPDSPALDVLETLLDNAPAGRLYKALVETKKAARTSCDTYSLKERSFMTCFAELQAKDATAPAREALAATVEGLAQKPPTAEEVEKAKAELLKVYDLVLNEPERVAFLLSETSAAGDWRLFFLTRDRTRAVTPEDVVRVAQKYLKPSNRTSGEYVPTEKPDRADIPALVDVEKLLSTYTGGASVAQGELFDATPANIEARTRRVTLPNGLKLSVVPKKTRGELVQLVLRLNYGTLESLTNQRAVGIMTGRLLDRGTLRRTRQQVKEELDRLKVILQVAPGPQSVTVSAEVRRPMLADLLALLGELLREPALDGKELEALKRELLATLEQSKDDPMALGQLGLQRLLAPYPKGHPFHIPSFPEQIAETQALKLEDVKAFHARFYGAQDGLMGVVGDVDAEVLQAQVTQLFGSWTAREKYVRVPTPYQRITPGSETVETPDKQMAFLGAGLTFPLKQTDPDFPALVMGNFMLGGGFLKGRIPARLREAEGLSYGAGSFLAGGRHDDNGLLGIYAIFAPQNASRVEAAYREELGAALSAGFKPDELKLAREGILQQRSQDYGEDPKVAQKLVEHLDLSRTYAWEQQLDDKLKALTLPQVNQAMKKHLDPSGLAQLKVGDFKLAPPAR